MTSGHLDGLALLVAKARQVMACEGTRGLHSWRELAPDEQRVAVQRIGLLDESHETTRNTRPGRS
jgi:hypothetical protein